MEKVNYTIGEIAEILQVAPSLIRFWEKEFEQLKPRKTSGGTRKYSRGDLILLKTIYQLVKIEGYTLPGAKEKLKLNPAKQELKTELTEKLNSIKTFLIKLKENLSSQTIEDDLII
ncbi:MAG: MerR family transcriptional regulator [Bacteroidia bacterium]|nr:MerR family transcriptional regulator [Bacteroidia bacterium]